MGLARASLARVPAGRGLGALQSGRARHRTNPPPLDAAMQVPREADIELARAAASGRGGAVDRLADRLSCVPALVRSLNGRLGNPLAQEEVEEVVQDALAALWSKLDRFDGRGAIETWAYGFCLTQVLKFLERRRRRRQVAIGFEGDRLADQSVDLRMDRLEFEWIHAALERLGPPADAVIRLKHFEELTFEEVGERLAISPNTAKTQYYRALRKLREVLAPLWRHHEEETRE